MNTLKFKALSIILKIYFTALFVYAIITLPSIVVPVIYIYSLYLAFIYGFVALAIFSIFYILVSKNKNRNTVWLVLMMSIPIAVSISYVVLCAVTKVSKPLEAGLFFLFPIAAIISGWTSLGLINKSIE